MKAEVGPAFNDFKEAINNGSIFSIITARGHNPNTLKQAVYNYIINDFNGISKEELVKNLRKYRSFVGEEEMTDNELIKTYLELNKYHPVSFGDEGGATNPEDAKVTAMEGFVDYTIGFSDDDIRNVEVMKKRFDKDPDNIVKTYYTGTGKKSRMK